MLKGHVCTIGTVVRLGEEIHSYFLPNWFFSNVLKGKHDAELELCYCKFLDYFVDHFPYLFECEQSDEDGKTRTVYASKVCWNNLATMFWHFWHEDYIHFLKVNKLDEWTDPNIQHFTPVVLRQIYPELFKESKNRMPVPT